MHCNCDFCRPKDETVELGYDQLLDLIANLSNKVTKLERELQGLRHRSSQNELDIYLLDERTQPLEVLKEALRDDE